MRRLCVREVEVMADVPVRALDRVDALVDVHLVVVVLDGADEAIERHEAGAATLLAPLLAAPQRHQDVFVRSAAVLACAAVRRSRSS